MGGRRRLVAVATVAGIVLGTAGTATAVAVRGHLVEPVTGRWCADVPAVDGNVTGYCALLRHRGGSLLGPETTALDVVPVVDGTEITRATRLAWPCTDPAAEAAVAFTADELTVTCPEGGTAVYPEAVYAAG